MSAPGDTIVSAATPPGVGGVAIVRISGDAVGRIGRAMLGRLPEPRFATLSSFLDADGAPVDTGIALYFPAPHSFTGEDVLELHGHGGPVLVSMLVDAVIALGARRAAAGEFSKRAFLNDKLDLTQAEAIADIIESGTAQGARAALRTLVGEFSTAVNLLVVKLTRLRVYVEAAIDFPEDEVDFLSDQQLAAQLQDCGAAFETLLKTVNVARVLRDGYRVVLIGKPNAGKSSLMNRLSGEDTAIVTDIAGTTRDILCERIDIDGLSVELIDTAGLRENPDVIEQEGIRRAHAAMAGADAVLWIQDVTEQEQTGRPQELPKGVPVLTVRNKIDIASATVDCDKNGSGDSVPISAKTGAGVDELRRRIAELAGYRNLGEGAYTARRRHVDALTRAEKHFAAGCTVLQNSAAGELLAEELRLAQNALGEITGEVSSDDLLGRIFSEFCIGK